MSVVGWAKSAPKKTVAKISGISLVSLAVVAGAIFNPGFTTAEVDLNDGGVWVTNRTAGLVGHLNNQSKILDGGFTSVTSGFDVVQSGSTVALTDDAGTILSPVDVPMMAMESETLLNGGKKTSLGSSVVAITDPGQGRVWAMDAAAASGFSDKSSSPVLKGLVEPVSVVAPNDSVFTVDSKTGTITSMVLGTNGAVASKEEHQVPELAGQKNLQITAAANQPVVLAPGIGQLFLPGGKKVALADAKDAVLQQASGRQVNEQQTTEPADFVGIATSKGLVRQPLDGSAATFTPLPAPGAPIAPVAQGSCFHAAWSGVNKYLSACGDDTKLIDIAKASASSKLVFRKNRDVVVLNDVNGGNVWLVNQNMVLVNNWDDLKTDLTKADNADKDSADPNVVNTLPDRTKPNRPPLAAADSFGVRAGKTTILPVLYNDSDPDGDVLTVQAPDSIPDMGTLQAIYGGTGLQLSVPSGVTGSKTFTYTAVDGRNGKAPAQVNVRVVPSQENEAPKAMRDATMVVEQGQTMSQNILGDWRDPDGDELFLTGAVSDDNSALIKTTPDGQLSYKDDGESTGMKSMTVSVSDGRETSQRKVKVNVLPTGAVPPVVNADFVRAVAGEAVVVAPLKNDQDPAGGTLRLASVAKMVGITNSAIADNGTFTLTAKNSGTFYLEYQATNGPSSATGLIRVDVVEKGGDGAPIAVKDLALLPAGGTALVDVLANDLDPSGGVLVVQSVNVPNGSPVSVSVINRNIVKIDDVRGLDGPLSIGYTVSNGRGSATGEISVVSIPAPDKLLGPRTSPDKATVRAGDVVSIPVLANDVDPNGETLKSPVIEEGPSEGDGKLFVDQNQLRFIAGPTAKTVTAVYKVANSTGQFDSNTLTITITAKDPEHNQPPAPKNVTGRVIAGETINIPIELNGVDPEGDSVELVGLDKAPALGTARIANGYIQYMAAGSSVGTDSFSYVVRDRLGAEATARVQVGIAPPLAVNQPPVTEDDVLSIRPGRKVAVDVLANDSDPDGGQLAVVKNGFQGPAEMQATVSTKGRVLLTSPQTAGTFTMMYTVTDKFGSKATGNIRMSVTDEAPLKPPVARDDRVTTSQVLGKNTVDVPVLDNDEDPDGVSEDLKLSLSKIPGLPVAEASVTAKGTIQIALTASEQMVPYTVTDVDGRQATAVIWVPGLGMQYPALAKNDVIHVVAGNSVDMLLADYVKVRSGKKPRITQVSKVTLLGASASNAVLRDAAGIRYAANADFYGPGSITFEVTDGSGPDDPNGLKSTLTVMTEVAPAPKKEPNKNVPPVFRGTTLEVPQAENVTQDLAPLASDPDPDDAKKLRFALSSAAPAGFKATLAGSVLNVSQASNANVGIQGTVQVSVSDGTNQPVVANVVLRATSSSKPRPVANDDVVADARAGRPETVQVLANDVNPFPDTPLRVVGASVETGGAGVKVSNTANSVTVSPAPDFKGAVVIKYVVEDKTKDANRTATGRVKLTVKGRPDAPAKPQIVEEKDKAVLLSWQSPSDNGSPITGYTVTWNGGSQECATNTCTINGLRNGTAYKFAVTAKNLVGTSPASTVSASAKPDRMPDAPAAPAVKFGDKQVTLTWVTPVGDFTPVKEYTVEISPADGLGKNQQPRVKGNSLTWANLSNGHQYTFKVQAINSAPKPSVWSPESEVVVPAGLPDLPAAPSVSTSPKTGGQSQVEVSWAAPFENGDAVSNYELEVSGGGEATRTIATTDTSQSVTVTNAVSPYSFRVRATNKAGTTGFGSSSAPARAVGQPGMMDRPGISILDTAGAGGKVQVTFRRLGVNELNGYATNEVSYCASLTTGAQSCGIRGNQVQLPSPNGTAVGATVWVEASAGSASSASNRQNSSSTVSPYGVPSAVPVSGGKSPQGQKKVSWSWSAPGNNGSNITKYRISVNGGGWTDHGMNTSYSTATGNFNDAATLAVQACNAGGCGASSGAVRAEAGGPSEWDTSLSNNRNCTEELGSITYDSNLPGDQRRCGPSNNNWIYAGEVIKVKCYVNKADDRGITRAWYRIEPGSGSNVGRYVVSANTYLGNPGGPGVPAC